MIKPEKHSIKYILSLCGFSSNLLNQTSGLLYKTSGQSDLWDASVQLYNTHESILHIIQRKIRKLLILAHSIRQHLLMTKCNPICLSYLENKRKFLLLNL